MSFETTFKNINYSIRQESANLKKISKIVFFSISLYYLNLLKLTNECS